MRISLRNVFALLVYSLLITTLAAFAGYQLRALWPPPSERYSLIKEAHRLLSDHFLDELPDHLSLERGMIRGMIAELDDPYTSYIEPISHELQTDNLSGEYGGVGAFLSRDDQGFYFLIPFEDGPAARAGVLEGERLIAVDGDPITRDSTQDEVLAMVRGPVGSRVSLTFAPREENGEEFTIEIEREAFPIPSVTGFILPSDSTIGVMVISFFSEKTFDEVVAIYQDLEIRGAESLIIDLRRNNGGLLEAAVEIARFFLKDGIVLIEHRRDDQEMIYRVEGPGEAVDIPLSILVDETTASAAEVLAAAIQTNNRAPLVGRPTYGKGSVQVVLELSDGSSLHVTTARWDTPDGRSMEPQGLQPDILVSSTAEDVDPIMLEAVSWLQSSNRGSNDAIGN